MKPHTAKMMIGGIFVLLHCCKTRLKQMVEEGLFIGGTVQYGYRLVNNGRVNKKGVAVKDKEIEPAEARIVQEVHQRAVLEGVGTFTLAEELNHRGLRTHRGAKFQANTVRRMLADPEYAGFIITSEAQSPHLPELQIIDAETKHRAIELVDKRKVINDENRSVARTCKMHALLGGNLFCGCCGKRLTAILKQDRYTRVDGTIMKKDKHRYICYHATRKLNDCSGQKTYLSEKVDAAVLECAQQIFERIRATPRDVTIDLRLQEEIKTLLHSQKESAQKTEKLQRQLSVLTNEIANCLLGESAYDEESLRNSIQKKKEELKSHQLQLAALNADLADKQSISKNIGTFYDRFVSWAEEFDSASLSRKRMILSELFPRIEVSDGYQIHIEVEMNYKRFLMEREQERTA